jgi:polysaccharide transporter, PST family
MKKALFAPLLDTISKRLEGRTNLKKIIQNSGWLYLEYVVQVISQLLVGIWVVRYLGPEKYGILSYAISFVALFAPLATLGLNHIVTREIIKSPEIKDKIMGTSFFLRILANILAITITMTAIMVLRPDDKMLQFAVAVLSLTSLFQSLMVIEFWFLSKVQSKYVAISKIIVMVISGIIRIVLVWSKASLIDFITVFAIEKVLLGLGLVIMYQFRGEKVKNWSFDSGLAKSLASQSWPLILSGIAGIIYLKIDQVMLLQMHSSAEVGIYAVAARISEFWYFVPNVIVASAFPALVEMREKNRDQYMTNLQKLYIFLAMLSLSIAIPLTFAATPLLTLIYGKEYSASGLILSIHIWASLFIFMRALLSKWIIAEGLLTFSLVTHVAGAMSNIILNFVLIPRYGGVGAAIATVVSYAAASYFALFLSNRTRISGFMMTNAIFYPIEFLIKVFIKRRK